MLVHYSQRIYIKKNDAANLQKIRNAGMIFGYHSGKLRRHLVSRKAEATTTGKHSKGRDFVSEKWTAVQ
jgi:hypothetical protein